MRATPSLSQTLRFSTFAPNAADRDVQALWTRMHGGLVGTKNGDARVMLGMPEDGSIVCFNTSAAQQEAGAGGQGNAGRTLWTSELGATV